MRGSGLQGLSLIDHAEQIGQIAGFVEIMRDQEDRNPDRRAQGPQLGMQAPARAAVERGKGLVEKQHARFPCKSASHGDALLLSARELCRAAILEPGEAHPRQQIPRRSLPFGARTVAHGRDDIAQRRHVGKQRIGLEHEPHGAAMRGSVDSGGGVEPDLPPQVTRPSRGR